MYSYDEMPEPSNEELRAFCYAALDRLDKKMLSLNCWPLWEVSIKTDGFEFEMPFSAEELKGKISFTMPRKALYAMLQRKIHFNNLEVGCHMEIHREPNEYCPDVHTLLAFFHV